MAGEFLHGVETIEIDEKPQPIRTVRSAVVGIVGAAEDKESPGRHDVPILIRGTKAAAAAIFGPGTLLDAIYGVLDQVSTLIVAVNAFDPTKHFGAWGEGKEVTLAGGTVEVADIPEGADIEVRSEDLSNTYEIPTHLTWDGSTLTRVAGAGAPAADAKLNFRYRTPSPAGADETAVAGGVEQASGVRTGAYALLDAESVTGYRPRILIAPAYSGVGANAPAGAALAAVAERMRAITVVDGPNTTDTAAIAFRKLFDSRRVYPLDPHVRVFDRAVAGEVTEPGSARVAGAIALNDIERGFWHSPSNRSLKGVVGTARPIDFTLGDAASTANHLNENQVATIIRAPRGGFRLWGNRAAVDPDSKWTFLSVGRTMDLINDSLERAHFWAVDRNITTTYLEAVAENVNGYLAMLQGLGAIRSGSCVPSARNTADARAAGRALFDIEFEPYTPAERLTFRVALNQGVAEEIAA